MLLLRAVSLATAQRSRSRRKGRPNRRLLAKRINLGLSPNDLARAAGVSGNTVRSAESGLIPGPRTQFAIAEALDTEPLEIWPLDQQVWR